MVSGAQTQEMLPAALDLVRMTLTFLAAHVDDLVLYLAERFYHHTPQTKSNTKQIAKSCNKQAEQ